MSHINYAFNPEDDALPRDKMKLRNIASTKYSGDWPSIVALQKNKKQIENRTEK